MSFREARKSAVCTRRSRGVSGVGSSMPGWWREVHQRPMWARTMLQRERTVAGLMRESSEQASRVASASMSCAARRGWSKAVCCSPAACLQQSCRMQAARTVSCQGWPGGDAFEVEQVEGKADYGAGVTDEAALPQGDGGVVFAGGGGGHGPEAGGACFEDVLHQGAESFMPDEADFLIQLCFHGVISG